METGAMVTGATTKEALVERGDLEEEVVAAVAASTAGAAVADTQATETIGKK